LGESDAAGAERMDLLGHLGQTRNNAKPSNPTRAQGTSGGQTPPLLLAWLSASPTRREEVVRETSALTRGMAVNPDRSLRCVPRTVGRLLPNNGLDPTRAVKAAQACESSAVDQSPVQAIGGISMASIAWLVGETSSLTRSIQLDGHRRCRTREQSTGLFPTHENVRSPRVLIAAGAGIPTDTCRCTEASNGA